MTDDLEWFSALPRLPRLYRATYGTTDAASGEWTLRPRYAEALRGVVT
jgi:hypothetical protein